MKEKVGKVTEAERDEIKSLFERRSGLVELTKIISVDNDDLYEKLVKDFGATEQKFQSWWTSMSEKYQWPSRDNCNWEIDFSTCEIFLVQA